MQEKKSNVLRFRNNKTPGVSRAAPVLEYGDYVLPNYTRPDQDQDDREAAEIRAATEFLGY